MSHIFDALQRSETERSGVETPDFSLATELLQIAEREASMEAEVPEAEAMGSSAATASAMTDLLKSAQLPADPEIRPAKEFTACGGHVDQFSQFQSLRLLVGPQSKLVCLTDKESLAAEKFRFLAVRLRQLQQSRRLKKVLITSSIPQEGKSMVAANLACTLARRVQQRTLLIEGDLRRPALSQLFGFGKLPGISEWLQGESGPMQSIYQLEGAGLWMLPAGSSPRNPLEIMQAGRLSALMEQLTAWFDWIIIDSPPVLPLADTSVWMRLSDGVLLVARPEITEKKQLQKGLEAIEKSKLIGALLNASREAAHSDYYQHYGASGSPSQSSPSAESGPKDDN